MKRKYALILLISLVINPRGFSQQLTVPRVSQKAVISQTIGLTQITISYHRPGVKGRKIWGGLVPYNQVWRAGANENTTISFSTPVKVEGKDLPAGSYGLHMIPAEKEWTIIFSKNSTSWGSFFYREDEDALRVKVKPQPTDFKEWLSYEFPGPSDDSVRVYLHWENLKIPFTIKVDVPGTLLAGFRNELRSEKGFTWQAFNQAANYCLQNDVNLEEAMGWVDKSLSINENFSNLRTKSWLMEKKNLKKESTALWEKALKIAGESDLNNYGYQLLNANQIDEAIGIFTKNTIAHPDSWNVYDSLGEAYEKKGDKKLAAENYRKALSRVGDENNKKRIEDILKKIK